MCTYAHAHAHARTHAHTHMQKQHTQCVIRAATLSTDLCGVMDKVQSSTIQLSHLHAEP